ncbi:MAG TPA: hypothetical protein VGP08_20830 [Pyrinomonadaceae bacterium]|jgi:hypothetical protein|nr:hypothetical protein [Pyrinomonadaceae bacterium]
MGDHDTSADAPSHHPGTRQGEEIKEADGKEPGRHDEGTTHADRPSGGSTARDSTAINPDDVESGSDSPNLPPA